MDPQHITKIRMIADMTTLSLKYAIELFESRHLFGDHQTTHIRLMHNLITKLGYQMAETLNVAAEMEGHSNESTSSTE